MWKINYWHRRVFLLKDWIHTSDIFVPIQAQLTRNVRHFFQLTIACFNKVTTEMVQKSVSFFSCDQQCPGCDNSVWWTWFWCDLPFPSTRKKNQRLTNRSLLLWISFLLEGSAQPDSMEKMEDFYTSMQNWKLRLAASVRQQYSTDNRKQ